MPYSPRPPRTPSTTPPAACESSQRQHWKRPHPSVKASLRLHFQNRSGFWFRTHRGCCALFRAFLWSSTSFATASPAAKFHSRQSSKPPQASRDNIANPPHAAQAAGSFFDFASFQQASHFLFFRHAICSGNPAGGQAAGTDFSRPNPLDGLNDSFEKLINLRDKIPRLRAPPLRVAIFARRITSFGDALPLRPSVASRACL